MCVLVCLAVEGGSCWAAGGEVIGRMKSRSERLSQQDIKVFVFFTHTVSLYKEGLYLEATSPRGWTATDAAGHWCVCMCVWEHWCVADVMLTCCWSVDRETLRALFFWLSNEFLSNKSLQHFIFTWSSSEGLHDVHVAAPTWSELELKKDWDHCLIFYRFQFFCACDLHHDVWPGGCWGCWLEQREPEHGGEGEEMAASVKCVCVSEYNVFELEFHSQRPCPMTSHWYDEKGVFVYVLYTQGDIICYERLDPFVWVCVLLVMTDCVIGAEMLDVIDSRNSILSPAATKSDSCHCLWWWQCGTHQLCRCIIRLLTFHSSSDHSDNFLFSPSASVCLSELLPSEYNSSYFFFIHFKSISVSTGLVTSFDPPTPEKHVLPNKIQYWTF